jgi:long-chain acyl-CoA synthetase
VRSDAAALLAGSTRLTHGELRERVLSWSGHAPDGRLVPLRSADQIELVIAALAVREGGGVPAVGDMRWSDSHWADLVRAVANSPLPAGAAWATFSSGSTGSPRVILRNHASWSSSFPALSRMMGLRADDIVLLPSPLVSSLSMFSVVHVLDAGAGVLLSATPAVSAAECERATLMHATPGALETVLELVESGTRTRIRCALIGGARLNADLRARAEAAGIRVVNYYGAAELSFVAVDVDGRGLRPFDGVELQIRDGELWSRSVYAAIGYLPGATGAFRTDADGWSSVGDLAGLDAAGLLTLRGRRDGAILTAAATVVPEDVEAVLRTLDGVKNSVVFGAPHPRIGSLVCAVIEPEDPSDPPSSAGLRAACRDRLGVAQIPRRWYLATELPLTSSGKPARADIAEIARTERMPRLA